MTSNNATPNQPCDNKSLVKTLINYLKTLIDADEVCGCCDQGLGNDCCNTYDQLIELGMNNYCIDDAIEDPNHTCPECQVK